MEAPADSMWVRASLLFIFLSSYGKQAQTNFSEPVLEDCNFEFTKALPSYSGILLCFNK